VSRINVLVAATSPDVRAEVIAESVAARPDMQLVEGRALAVDAVDAALDAVPLESPCAVIIFGDPVETAEMAERWLEKRPDLVVMLLDVADDIVRITLRDPRLNTVLTALRALVERVDTEGHERVVQL
jgi:hypothetical protein